MIIRSGCLAVLFLLFSHGAASAQDFPGTPGQQPGITAWCAAVNGERGELYLSAPRRLHSTSPMVVGSLSGHFAQTVNARFGTHLIMSASHCHAFKTAAASESARGALVTNASKQALVIRDPGIF
ncbi:hypothetical protein [Acetobacter fallax]|uniref:Uncharacterized protein n=1 Tax=Acetobacter fallax TaxID=1737473 RepID=A0ABX0KCZ9_9PROT|nr:hypothetical protein [Acetobacter fallax]NHO33033.1 hypothetical protein [Acetobacter fallax]NHO36599.1 hypothetical protein [Acetobacter fallax]